MIWKVKGNMKGKYFNFIFLINYVDLSFHSCIVLINEIAKNIFQIRLVV